jgi:hypothetical protein
MKSINLNTLNVTGSNNSKLIKKLPNNIKFDKNDKLAFNNLVISHSFFNISPEFNNNEIEIVYNNQTTIIRLDPGFYELSDINFALQLETIKTTNNLPYCITNSGDYLYFYELIYNSTFYSVQLNVYPVVFPAGATNPKNAIFNQYCPQIKFNNNISDLLGLQKNIYYPSISSRLVNFNIYSYQLNLVPNFSPLSTILITCNLINNELDEPNNIIYSFSTNIGSYGTNLSVKPSEMIFIDVKEGIYNQIEIEFLNADDYKPIKINDKNMSLSLILHKTSY